MEQHAEEGRRQGDEGMTGRLPETSKSSERRLLLLYSGYSSGMTFLGSSVNTPLTLDKHQYHDKVLARR